MRLANTMTALLLVLAVSGGCAPTTPTDPAPSGSAPQPARTSATGSSTPTPGDTPALSVAEAATVLAHVADVQARAGAKRDLELVATVLTGEELDYARVEYLRQEKFRLKPDTSFPKAPVQSVWSGPADRYPQTAFVVSKFPDKEDAKYRLVIWLVRSDAAAPWRTTMATYVLASQLPKIARTPSGVTPAVDPAARVNGVAPHELSALLTAALQNPASKGAKRFTGDAQAKTYRTQAAALRDQYAKGSNYRFSARPGFAAVPTADGGVLISTTVDVAKTTVPRRGTAILFVKGRYQQKRFPGTYRQIVERFRDTVVVYVPPAGDLKVLTHVVVDTDSSVK